MKYRRRYITLLCALAFFAACNPVDTGQQKVKESAATSTLIARAKQATLKYNLSAIKITCIDFEIAKENFEGKSLVDAHEIHNPECGGDPQTSPRLFSIAFDDRTGEVWSDAKSSVGQMEIIGKEGG